jgi:hypothetical protein
MQLTTIHAIGRDRKPVCGVTISRGRKVCEASAYHQVSADRRCRRWEARLAATPKLAVSPPPLEPKQPAAPGASAQLALL